MEKLHYSLNHYFTHMLLWFKECVTAAGIDASLCNTDPMCHWSLCLRVEHVTLSLCESLWQSRYSTIYCVLRYTGCTVFYQNAEHFFLVCWLSAGSAGDWFSDGEEGDGAQTRNHSAEGEFLYLFFSDWPDKTVWFYGTKCLNAENWAKRLQKSSDCWRHWTIFSFCFWGASSTFLSVVRPSSPVYLHTHTHTPDTTLNLRAPSCLSVIDIPLW